LVILVLEILVDDFEPVMIEKLSSCWSYLWVFTKYRLKHGFAIFANTFPTFLVELHLVFLDLFENFFFSSRNVRWFANEQNM
jgi:hypothetical protein